MTVPRLLQAVFLCISCVCFSACTTQESQTLPSPTPESQQEVAQTDESIEPFVEPTVLAPQQEKQGITREIKTLVDGTVYEYTSPQHGLRFMYVSPSQGGMHVFEEDTRICVTYDTHDSGCEKGQSLQIFTKEEKHTLSAAITAQLLQEIPKAQCYVEALTGGKYSKPRSTFTYAQIAYPNKATDEDPFSLSTAKNCPEAYRAMNGVRYFAMDRKYPEKFLFFNIGQYAISSGEKDQTWDETVQFFVEDTQESS